jgi:hypothetical protein
MECANRLISTVSAVHPETEINRLGHRFSIDFLFGNHKHLAKVPRLFEIFKIHRLVWIFGCFECVSSSFCLKLLLMLHVTNAFLKSHE